MKEKRKTSPKRIKVRLAEKCDYKGVNLLLNELTKDIGKTKVDYHHVYDKAKRKKMFEVIVEGHDPRLVVAEIGKRIVGYANIQELITLRHSTWELLIFEFIVAKKYRRNGVGTKMINWIKRFADNTGARRVKVFCGNDLVTSQAFYEKNGFCCENRGYVFRLNHDAKS